MQIIFLRGNQKELIITQLWFWLDAPTIVALPASPKCISLVCIAWFVLPRRMNKQIKSNMNWVAELLLMAGAFYGWRRADDDSEYIDSVNIIIRLIKYFWGIS